jgi:PKD repeat protein
VLTVNFSGSASGGTPPYSYGWSFGDGATSSAQNTEHSYSETGNFTSILTVTDNENNQNSDSVNIDVTAAPLNVNFTPSPASGQAPLTVVFAGVATGGSPPYSYNWDFGDGNSSSDQNPSHTFSQAGDFNVILTVTDDADASESHSDTITAYENPDPPVASATAVPTMGQTPLQVSFSGAVSGGTPPYTYSWDFGDGGSSNNQNPPHTYYQSGNQTAVLTVKDNENETDTDSILLNVSDVPLLVSLTADPTSGQNPLRVNFSGQATGGTPPYNFSWDFGEGAATSDQTHGQAVTQSHTFQQNGLYRVVLTVVDSQNIENSNYVEVTVTSNPLDAVLSASTTFGEVPLSVDFTGSAEGGSPPYTYEWNFGDGHTSKEQNPTHTFTQNGDFLVTLTVKDDMGTKANETESISAPKEITKTSLSISSATGDPAPDFGGTTDPAPGSHPYLTGSSISVKARSNEDYRFSRWSGDVSETDEVNAEITISMNKNKELTATFCVKCGDVNGDLDLTPADAQIIFDIFLKKLQEPTDCQLENADVNIDGTQTEPKVTPSDAQAVFEEYLGKKELPGDCSNRARAAGLAPKTADATGTSLSLNDISGNPGDTVSVPVIISNPFNLSSFGFDINFSSDSLEFIEIQKTELTRDYHQVGGNVIEEGVLRIGGYGSEPIQVNTPGELVTLIFKIKEETREDKILRIINTEDGVKGARTRRSKVKVKR